MKILNSHTPIAAMIMAAGFMGLPALTSCSTAPSSPQGRSDLRQTSSDVLSKAQENDPSMQNLIQNSAGCAVFPTIGKGAAGIGGAYGKGDVYQAGAIVGYCDMTQATIGLQLGGQGYTEILVFQTQDAVERFKSGNFRFDAQATAVAIKSGAGANAAFANGVAVFTMDEEGLMYEASVGGQQFTYQNR